MTPQVNMVAQAMMDQQRMSQDWYQNALTNQVNTKRMLFSGGPPSGQPGYRPYKPAPQSSLTGGLYGLGGR